MNKKLLLITCALIGSFSANSQSACIKDSAYYFSEQNDVMNRVTWQYDNEGRILNETHSSHDGTDWYDFKQRIITYAANGKIATYELKDWDSGYEAMMPYSLTTNTYNANGDLTLKDSTRFGSNGYGPFFKVENTYGSNNLLESQAIWNYDNSNQEWDGTLKNNYTYDSDNRQINVIQQSYVNSAWVNMTKISNTYQGTTNMVSMLEESTWNTSNSNWSPVRRVVHTISGGLVWETFNQIYSNGWQNQERIEYGYDQNDNLTMQTFSVNVNGVLRPVGRTQKQFSNNLLTSEASFSISLNNGSQTPTYRKTFEYVSNSTLLSSVLHLTYNSNQGVLLPNNRILHTYNNNGRLTQTLQHKLTEQGQLDYTMLDERWTYYNDDYVKTHSKYLYEGGSYNFNFNYENYYSNCVEELSIDQVAKNTFSVYPNPVENAVKFIAPANGKATLFSTTGKVMLVIDMIQGENAIDMQQFESGIYLLKMDNGLDAKIIKL